MPNALSDEELMLDVRNGVGEMLSVLFQRYQTPLFNFFLRLTGDRAASEDLVQELFYRVLKYRESYRPGTPFRSWVYQIARNVRVDWAKKRRPEQELEPEMGPTVIPMDRVEQQQETELLRRALLKLSDEKREVLVLSRFQELKYDEIARALDCEVGTVKVRVHRALQDLREIFKELNDRPQRGREASSGSRP